MTYSNGSASRPYKFTLGEIVKRRYKDGDSKEWQYDEVIVFGEKGYVVDVVTFDELCRTGSKSECTKAKMVWIDDVESIEPKRFFMDCDELMELVVDMFNA